MARRRRACGCRGKWKFGSLDAWKFGFLVVQLFRLSPACRAFARQRPFVARLSRVLFTVFCFLFSGARQRPFVARLSRVLFTVFCFLFSGARQRPFVARLSGVLFSVAVEGLALWACTLCSPFSRARKRFSVLQGAKAPFPCRGVGQRPTSNRQSVNLPSSQSPLCSLCPFERFVIKTHRQSSCTFVVLRVLRVHLRTLHFSPAAYPSPRRGVPFSGARQRPFLSVTPAFLGKHRGARDGHGNEARCAER